MIIKRIVVGAVLALALGGSVNLASAVAQSPAPVGDSAILAPRLVPLEGVQNFRDIGGYRTTDGRRVKWGLIYRSAELSHLTPTDLEALGRLNVQAVHDLRSVSERQAEPTAWTGPDAPLIVAHDYQLDMSAIGALFQGPVTVDRARDAFASMYPSLLDTQRPQETALFETLLNADGATLYHCTAGKDRTGLATALILSALGVPRETILYDYELSNRYFTGGIAARDGQSSQAQSGMPNLPPEIMAVFMQVDARYLRATFAQIDNQYGSVEAYLDQRLGVDAAEIARLRELYTE